MGQTFMITNVVRVGSDIVLSFPSEAASYYKVRTCTDVVAGDWATDDLFFGVCCESTWTNVQAAGFAPLFHAVRQVPLTAPEDDDADGLDDVYEMQTAGLDALNPDSDGDGMLDGWEVTYGLDATSAEGQAGATGDPDSDGVDNLTEYLQGRNPSAPAIADPGGVVMLEVYYPSWP